MPLDPQQKRDVAERLMRGEDVEITASDAEVAGNGHHHGEDVQIPLEAIIGRLGQRIGKLEADLAVAQAHAEAATTELQQVRMALLEAQLRETTKEHADG